MTWVVKSPSAVLCKETTPSNTFVMCWSGACWMQWEMFQCLLLGPTSLARDCDCWEGCIFRKYWSDTLANTALKLSMQSTGRTFWLSVPHQPLDGYTQEMRFCGFLKMFTCLLSLSSIHMMFVFVDSVTIATQLKFSLISGKSQQRSQICSCMWGITVSLDVKVFIPHSHNTNVLNK